MARSRIRIVRAGILAGVAVGTVVATGACTPFTPEPANVNEAAPSYELCNSTGCGDNVNIVIDKDK